MSLTSPNASRVLDLVAAMNAIAPLAYAEAWDNVGLLAGDASASLSRVMLTIDLTTDVLREAIDAKVQAIVAYHPPIFEAMKRVVGPSVVYEAIRHGIAIYSPHTAWDAAAGGANDFLADLLALQNRKPIKPIVTGGKLYKLVTFVPEDDVEKVSSAVHDAGAGRIGDYSHCSFRSGGKGVFLPESGADPTIGKVGRIESVTEIRFETVVPQARLADVLAAMKAAHPYEEPAFDLFAHAERPTEFGAGRIGDVSGKSRAELIEHIRMELKLDHLLIAGPTDGPVTRAACCAGAGASLLGDAIAQGATFYLTGEMRHHDALKAARDGVTVVCTLHSRSERASLTRLRDRIATKLPNLELILSQSDRDPFTIH